MRHRKKLKKLGLAEPHRNSLVRNQIASLILHGKIRTTEGRAKAVAAKFGRMMRVVKNHEPREAIRLLPEFCRVAGAAHKLMQELKPKYEGRASGFTRITAVGVRKGDNSKLVQLELI